MKRWYILLAFVAVVPVVVLCCDGDDAVTPPDAGVAPTATTTTTAPTATTTATVPTGDAAVHRTGCLERPTQLPRPSDKLPCELIPPGLTL